MEIVKDNIEENKEVENTNQLEQEAVKEEKIVYEPYSSFEERNSAIAEANLLCQMINSHYYYIHGSLEKRNKKGEIVVESQVTKSTAISVFKGEQIDMFTQRLVFINNRLVQDKK